MLLAGRIHRQPFADLLADACPHLARGLVRKRDSDDAAKRQTVFQQAEIAAHERARLAGACAGGDDDGHVTQRGRCALWLGKPERGQDGWHIAYRLTPLNRQHHAVAGQYEGQPPGGTRGSNLPARMAST